MRKYGFKVKIPSELFTKRYYFMESEDLHQVIQKNEYLINVIYALMHK